jgi:hypothetical protein
LEQSQDEQLAMSLERTSRTLEVLTVALIVLVSPISFAFSLPFNVAPETWLSLWAKYVFFFIVLAIFLALAGFGAAASYRVRADAVRRSTRKH